MGLPLEDLDLPELGLRALLSWDGGIEIMAPFYAEGALAATARMWSVSLAVVLAGLEGRPDIAETLQASFERMLARYREAEGLLPELAPKPRPKRDYRRRKRA